MKSKKKEKILIGCGGALGVFLILIFILDSIKVEEWRPYRSTKYGIEMSYPLRWIMNDTAEIPKFVVSFVSPKSSPFDQFSENVSVTVEKIVKPGLTFPGFCKMAADQVVGTFGKYMEVTERRQLTVDGHQAQVFAYEGRAPGYKDQLKYQHTFVLADDQKTVFIITYISQMNEVAKEKNWKIAKKIINSFKFIR